MVFLAEDSSSMDGWLIIRRFYDLVFPLWIIKKGIGIIGGVHV
jgi:hypothetical protein